MTSDVWAYLRYLATATLPSKQEHEAISFIDQSLEFFEAAGTPRIGSRPLLFYYSFLNLAKAVLLLQEVSLPVRTQHGIFYPQDNVRSRLRFSGQKVGFEKAAKDHSKLFPEFVRSLGGEIPATTLKKVLPLFRQIPAVHRTYCRVTGERPSFLPIKAFELLRSGNKIHARLILTQGDADVQTTLPTLQSRQGFRRVFRRVHPDEKTEIWFQTSEVQAVKRGTDTAIRKLSESIQQIGLWPILTQQGHRYYFGTFPPRDVLPPLATVYAVMFYLGSISRYQPYDFHRIVQKFSWLVGEFLKTQPMQFLYGVASLVGGVDVVRPFASVD